MVTNGRRRHVLYSPGPKHNEPPQQSDSLPDSYQGYIEGKPQEPEAHGQSMDGPCEAQQDAIIATSEPYWLSMLRKTWHAGPCGYE